MLSALDLAILSYTVSQFRLPNSPLRLPTNKIQRFGADMGGTEIYDGLKRVFDQPLKAGYPRFVFLLTDGAVSNTEQVLHLIQSNNNNKAQVFSIGIGSGCSAELITKAASNGRGKYEFVVNSQEIYEKVISLLQSSLNPCLSDISFHADNFDAVVKSVSPNPATVPHLLNGQTATYFLFLRKEAFSETTHTMIVRIRMYDSKVQNYRTVEVNLDSGNVIENDMIAKLGIHSMIQGLESQKSQAVDNVRNVLWMQKEEMKNTLLEPSIKYGILCKDTAFVCEVKEKDKIATQQVEAIKVTIPAIRKQTQIEERVGNYYCIDQIEVSSEDEDMEIAEIDELQNEAFTAEDEDDFIDVLCSRQKTQSNKKELKQSYSQQPAKRLPVTAEDECKFEDDEDYFDEDQPSRQYVSPKNEESKQPHSQQPANKLSYLDVVMKQDFDGFWDPSDKQLLAVILKASTLPQPPATIKSISNVSVETLWVTILVLIWFEMACQSDKKAWVLIHQKGCEWLKEQGVDYQSVKDVGLPYIKT